MIAVGVAFLYFVPCWALLGRTPGMMVVGIHVIHKAAPRLGGIGWEKAIARTIGYVISWFTLSIGFLFGLHDKIGNTDAVTIAAQPAYPAPPPPTFSPPAPAAHQASFLPLPPPPPRDPWAG